MSPYSLLTVSSPKPRLCVKNAEAQKSKETCSRSLSLLRWGGGLGFKTKTQVWVSFPLPTTPLKHAVSSGDPSLSHLLLLPLFTDGSSVGPSPPLGRAI